MDLGPRTSRKGWSLRQGLGSFTKEIESALGIEKIMNAQDNIWEDDPASSIKHIGQLPQDEL